MSKEEVRNKVWDLLEEQKAARFPFPIKGRIPNFKGAEAAAQQVCKLEAYQKAKVVKVNPDSPQIPLRAQVLRDGKILLIPTPRLKAGFIQLNPEDIPRGEEKKAVSLKHMNKYGEEISLSDMPVIDLVVVGSVAIHEDGRRLGKGEGYADREYAILRELGNPAVPIVTTIHSLQLVQDDFPRDAYDVTVDYIATEREVIQVESPYDKPTGIVWDQVTEEQKKEMPILEDIWALK
ncbi:5-formyltetrahydrofolate cyclo-ligase [Pontibacillus salicampi]|uniref:5-formyltetrahydrofolate cyclo-ligase n=1 Tax=Pontibacillus salicampi TaxID=1449801 RepID=A0ABV6LRN4_9BACI